MLSVLAVPHSSVVVLSVGRIRFQFLTAASKGHDVGVDGGEHDVLQQRGAEDPLGVVAVHEPRAVQVLASEVEQRDGVQRAAVHVAAGAVQHHPRPVRARQQLRRVVALPPVRGRHPPQQPPVPTTVRKIYPFCSYTLEKYLFT